MVVAQLAERSLPIPEDPGSISSQLLLNIYLLLTVCRKDENKEKEAGNGRFFEEKKVGRLQHTELVAGSSRTTVV